jgi:hypothetical protein
LLPDVPATDGWPGGDVRVSARPARLLSDLSIHIL